MSDFLSDEEQLEKLKNWWDENGTSLIVGLVLAVAVVVGWRWYDSARTSGAQAASDLYASFIATEGEARTAMAIKIDDEIGGTSYQIFSLFYRARDAANEGDVEAAEAYLNQAIAIDAADLLSDVARIRLARLLQQQDKSEAALGALSGVRGIGFRAQVLELKGDIHWVRDERELAHEAYTSASAELDENEHRPLLDMKVADTANPNAS